MREVLFQYGSALRERGYSFMEEAVGDTVSGKDNDKVGSKVVEAAKAFKEAAGLYQYLADTMLPPLEEELPGDRWSAVCCSSNLLYY